MNLQKLTDEELILNLQKVKKSSQIFDEYLEEIFKRYKFQVYNLSRYYGLQNDDSMDVIQETFIKLLNFYNSFKKDRAFKPWFFKIVLNSIRNKYNELKKYNYIEIEKISPEIIFEENFEKVQKRECIVGILNRLPEKFKEVLLLDVYGGLTYEEIADTLGITLRQVYNRLNKAYELVRGLIGENIDDF